MLTKQPLTSFSAHALWLAGFRPFFAAATIVGAIFPLLWAAQFSGLMILSQEINPLRGHAHEMFYGFGGAVLFGFLLTASKNWVGVRGIHGWPLVGVFALWLIERMGLLFYSSFSVSNQFLFQACMSLFVMITGAYIITTLIRNRERDSFKDNYFFVFMLVLILVAKNLMLSQNYYVHGIGMTLGLFRLAFTVMFERTMTQFMKNTEGLQLYRNKFLDFGIKVSIAVAVFQSFFSTPIKITVLSIAMVLLFARWLLWRPDIGIRKFGNFTMYLGYLGLILHLFAEILSSTETWSFGAYSTHVFTFLCMGVVVASMLVRISKGHTGRKPGFASGDKAVIVFLLAASVFRLLLPLILVEYYRVWIAASALCWSFGFAILGVRIIPLLSRPRIDGKVH